MTGIAVSAWLAAGYGAVLVLVAYAIDRMARRAQTRLQEQRTPGFVYHEDHDAWLCPEDQWLWPRSFDPDNRVMRYRGSPSVCNSCPVKESCTSSADGREMRRMVDTWPASESARFHRGIACAVTVAAVAWPLASVLAEDGWAARGFLLGVSLALVVASLPLWAHLRRTPADPHGVLVQTVDQNLEVRTSDADALARRRTRYASDRKVVRDV
ncbi:MAG TPA: hypothetical protein GX694_13865 [Actinomycetales bacterium]|nr:hypothetical protein [Actinomycetales bacterium]